MSLHFCTKLKGIVFLRKYYYKRKTTLPNLQEREIELIILPLNARIPVLKKSYVHCDHRRLGQG